jgi:hypothetical protein
LVGFVEGETERVFGAVELGEKVDGLEVSEKVDTTG